eukprot:3190131-Rhodomonas_salina.2
MAHAVLLSPETESSAATMCSSEEPSAEHAEKKCTYEGCASWWMSAARSCRSAGSEVEQGV